MHQNFSFYNDCQLIKKTSITLLRPVSIVKTEENLNIKKCYFLQYYAAQQFNNFKDFNKHQFDKTVSIRSSFFFWPPPHLDKVSTA